MFRRFRKFGRKYKGITPFFAGAILGVGILLLPLAIFAAPADFGLSDLAGLGLGGAQDPRLIIVNIIRILLGFLGILAVIIVLYGGFVWMTSGGNAQKIEKAKKILINGLIGLAIILSAYAIVSFVIWQFQRILNPPPNKDEPCQTSDSPVCSADSGCAGTRVCQDPDGDGSGTWSSCVKIDSLCPYPTKLQVS